MRPERHAPAAARPLRRMQHPDLLDEVLRFELGNATPTEVAQMRPLIEDEYAAVCEHVDAHLAHAVATFRGSPCRALVVVVPRPGREAASHASFLAANEPLLVRVFGFPERRLRR